MKINNKILLLALVLMLSLSTCFASDNKKDDNANIKNIGNVVKKEEYPNSENVAPVVNKQQGEDTYVVEGSVEKNIDITLNECI